MEGLIFGILRYVLFKKKKHFHLASSLSVRLFNGKKVSIKMAHI